MQAGASAEGHPEAAGRFTLWQLENQTPTQMMSYVLRTEGGSVIAIDGGMTGDARYLAKVLRDLGGEVEAWFLTHPHADHVDTLVETLGDPGDLQIRRIYASHPTRAWMAENTSEAEQDTVRRVEEAVEEAGMEILDLELGQELVIDGVVIEVLGIRNPDITANPINNQSIILRISDAHKSVLFTGDLGPEAGEKALNGPYADRLHADTVQMAHHGQNGVNRRFYEHVGATACLWPTPDWLWRNDNGGGVGSGPWKTLEVRKWMEELGIERHYVMAEGLQKIQ